MPEQNPFTSKYLNKAPSSLQSSRHWVPPLLVVFVAVFAVLGANLMKGSHAATPGCTTTVNSVATAQTAMNSAANGDTVCMAAGNYGSITLAGNHTANVTFEPDPSLDPNGAGKVTLNGITIGGNYITVRNFYITGNGVVIGTGVSPWPPVNHVVVDHNNVGPVSGYGIDLATQQTGTLSSFITISNNKVHDTSSSSEGDAIRIDGWQNVTITGNEIYNIKECPANNCHTDTLQSYQAEVPTSGLTITKNYIHDNASAQGFPFLSNGDISNVTINDNLSLRMSSAGEVTGIFVTENTPNLVMNNNTYVGTSGSVIKAAGSAANPAATVSHNIFDQFNNDPSVNPKYSLTEDHNIFTGTNEWSFTLAGTDQYNGSTGISPVFKCATAGSGGTNICGNGTAAGDDYELASNPNGIGIDWSPAAQQYGPVSGSGTSSSQTNCFASPKNCGYPDPTVTTGSGVVGPVDGSGNALACNGAGMTSSGSITSTSTNQVIQNLNVTGYIHVTSSGVQLKNVCITQSGGGATCTNSTGPASTACFPLWVSSGSVSITNSTIRGSDNHSNSIIGISSTSGAAASFNHSYLYNCSECIHDGPWTIADSYINANADSLNTAHPEDIYMSDSTLTATHNTILNPTSNTAIIFGDTHGGSGGACDNNYQVTGNLMAGGGFMFYLCGNATSAGSAGSNFSNNRFGRCITPPITFQSGPGGYVCNNASGNNVGAGADTNGYWPYGGYYGVTQQGAGTNNTQALYTGTWSNNVWDDNCVTVLTTDKYGGTGTVSANCPSGGSSGSGGTSVPGDLDNNGHVNVFDLSILLSHWNQTGSGLTGDLDNNAIVNIFDLSILLSHYGS